MGSGLEQHRPQYEELIQLYEVIESRAHPSGLAEFIEVKEALTKSWIEIEKLLNSKRKDLEAATEGIEEIMVGIELQNTSNLKKAIPNLE